MEKKTVQIAEAKPSEEEKPKPSTKPKIKIPPQLDKVAKQFGLDLGVIVQEFTNMNKRIDRLEKVVTILAQKEGAINPSGGGGGGLGALAPIIQGFIQPPNPLMEAMTSFMQATLNNTLMLQQQQMKMNAALITQMVKKGYLE